MGTDVRSLLAKFEQNISTSANNSPPSRGRSPAAPSEHSSSDRPVSRVRANFIAVDSSLPMRTMPFADSAPAKPLGNPAPIQTKENHDAAAPPSSSTSFNEEPAQSLGRILKGSPFDEEINALKAKKGATVAAAAPLQEKATPSAETTKPAAESIAPAPAGDAPAAAATAPELQAALGDDKQDKQDKQAKPQEAATAADTADAATPTGTADANATKKAPAKEDANVSPAKTHAANDVKAKTKAAPASTTTSKPATKAKEATDKDKPAIATAKTAVRKPSTVGARTTTPTKPSTTRPAAAAGTPKSTPTKSTITPSTRPTASHSPAKPTATASSRTERTIKSPTKPTRSTHTSTLSTSSSTTTRNHLTTKASAPNFGAGSTITSGKRDPPLRSVRSSISAQGGAHASTTSSSSRSTTTSTVRAASARRAPVSGHASSNSTSSAAGAHTHKEEAAGSRSRVGSSGAAHAHKAPDGSFLARMMRPTASSANKMHDKHEVVGSHPPTSSSAGGNGGSSSTHHPARSAKSKSPTRSVRHAAHGSIGTHTVKRKVSKTPDTGAAVKAVEKEKEAEKKKVEQKKKDAKEGEIATEGAAKPASTNATPAKPEAEAIEPIAAKEGAASHEEGKSVELPIRKKKEEVAPESDAKGGSTAESAEPEGATEELVPSSNDSEKPAEVEKKENNKPVAPEAAVLTDDAVKAEDAAQKQGQTNDAEEQRQQNRLEQEVAN